MDPNPWSGSWVYPYIERVILTAKQAGIDEFVVVVGYLGKKIRAKLGDGGKLGVKITCIQNTNWETGNGVSVLKAKELLKEEFVLLMAERIATSSSSSLARCSIRPFIR